MMQPTSGPANGDIRGGDEEALLARCIERYPEVGPAVVDEVALGHPERAARLRSRLAALERLGLLVGRGQRPAPTRIGPYQILDLLGEGGMGAVYLARDERSGERVALKIGHAHRGSGPATEAGERARARFEREIRAVRQLEHPGIVPIREVGDSDGQP
jgi:serine/threonine protein kinase